MSTLSYYVKKSLIYFGIFILFTINLIALSISLSCNQDRYFGFRLVSALFAFLFGLVYIMFNYLQYRVKIKGEMQYDAAAERQAIFEHVWLRTQKIFYHSNFHGVDWDLMKKEYQMFF